MKSYKLLSLLGLFSLSFVLFAQEFPKGNYRGKVQDEQKTPLIGANIHWLGTSIGTTTDAQGSFQLTGVNHSNQLIISYVGFVTDTLLVTSPAQEIKITLQDEIALEEVVVSTRRFSTLTSRIDPIQTQTISSDELCRAACCNLAESFETNASVDVTYSDAATGARQIRLLGLSGLYVQMMTEQFPNLQGAASAFGMNFVPGTWMESINVSKGTGSVKNGFEALTGQINIEYKKPQLSDLLSVNLFASHMGRLEANADAAININDKLSTGLFLHYSQDQSDHDENEDGFIDLPQTQQYNVMNRWYYKSDRYIFQALAQAVRENRQSGQAEHDTHLTDPYRVDIESNRLGVYTKQGYILNKLRNRSVALILSGTYHEQQSLFGNNSYDVQQKNLYANLIFETGLSKRSSISTGVSYTYDQYDELANSSLIDGYDHLNLDHLDHNLGAYFQYTYLLDEKFTLQAGVRADHLSEHGMVYTPRLHLKYSPFGHWLNLRASAGRGYRIAQVLVENSYLLASSRKWQVEYPLETLEQAWNYGASAQFSLNVVNKPLSLMLEWYYTDFDDHVTVDLETPGLVRFYNQKGRAYAQNAQVEISYPFFKGFLLTGAYRWTETKTTYDDLLLEKPMTNRYKALLTGSYKTPGGGWQFDVTGAFNGEGRLPDPGVLGKWEQEFPSYASLNAQVTYYFKNGSIYLGGENLTGYKQPYPIIDADRPFDENAHFDATMVWGPIHGAKFYVGLRYAIPQK